MSNCIVVADKICYERMEAVSENKYHRKLKINDEF